MTKVSIRRTDLCAFEPRASKCLAAQRSSFNPSNGFVCLRTRPRPQPQSRESGVSIRRTDLCAFELPERGRKRGECEVSIRRTDLCAFERRDRCRTAAVADVSIRRTDLCAFERCGCGHRRQAQPFQSVERICVPSNADLRAGAAFVQAVSIRRTDLCAFELELAQLGGGEVAVSIRRTDLCAFEPRAGRCAASPWHRFNPSNGFVCLRTRRHGAGESDRTVSIRRTDLCAFEHRTDGIDAALPTQFQSVERICVPSNGGVGRAQTP